VQRRESASPNIPLRCRMTPSPRISRTSSSSGRSLPPSHSGLILTQGARESGDSHEAGNGRRRLAVKRSRQGASAAYGRTQQGKGHRRLARSRKGPGRLRICTADTGLASTRRRSCRLRLNRIFHRSDRRCRRRYRIS
jgi:hypothetical protein